MIKQKIYSYEKARSAGYSFKKFLIGFLTDRETNLEPFEPENIKFDFFDKMKDVDNIIKSAVRNNKTVVIMGDYDTDGITASAIMYKVLKAIYPDVDIRTILPDRHSDGYGLKNKHVDNAYNQNASVIITVDNGINAIKSCKYAMSKGMEVILTDHHIPNNSEWQDLEFVMNPHTSKSTLKEHEICGAMVALLFGLNLMKTVGYEASDKFIKELKEIASIGTIGDSMPIRYENRALLKECMPRFLEGVAINKGLQLLINSLSKFTILEQDNIAFYLVPCINACGRLDSAYLGFELLTSESVKMCATLATKLVSLNDRRKLISKDIETYLKSQIDANSRVQILQVPEKYHDYSDREIGGIVGITASKVVEESKCPSLIFYGDRFSGRSMPDINLNQLLASSTTPTFTFGGHAQACGGGVDFTSYGISLKDELNKNIKQFDNNVFYEKFIKVPHDVSPLEILKAFTQIKPCDLSAIPSLMLTDVKIESINTFSGHSQITFTLNNKKETAVKFYDTLPNVKEGDVVSSIIFKVSPSTTNDYQIIVEKVNS